MSENNGMTPYEQIKVMNMNRRPSGVGIAGLCTGIAGIVVAVGAGFYAAAKASEARKVAEASNAGTAALLNRLATQYDGYMSAERAERIAGDLTISQNITDSISGQQSSSLTAMQQSELSAVNSVMQQTFADAITGRSSLNATPVQLYSAPQPCGCPNGCGCNN